jgi:hypothetical protein
MHFHLPRPLHGWREFAGEVGIIVLGVLIALGFGQIVEAWQWRGEVGSTRQAIAGELGNAAIQAAERVAIKDCLRNRIDELATKLNAGNGRWAGDPLQLGQKGRPEQPKRDNHLMKPVYSGPLRGWSQDVWDTAKSSGTLNHMSHDEVTAYSNVYGEIAAIRDFQNQEFTLESSLSFLSTDQQIDNQSRVETLGKLGQLHALNGLIAGLGSLMLDQIKALHLRAETPGSDKQAEQMIAVQRQARGACVKDVHIPL